MTAMARHASRWVQDYSTAEAMVLSMVEQWQMGRPLRLVRKLLRKRGIHPWSMLIHLEGDAYESLARALGLPAWARPMCNHLNPQTGEMGFQIGDSLPGQAALPEGLVAPSLWFDRSLRCRKLPHRAWTPWLTLTRMPAIRTLPPWAFQVNMMVLELCPALKSLPKRFARICMLEIVSLWIKPVQS